MADTLNKATFKPNKYARRKLPQAIGTVITTDEGVIDTDAFACFMVEKKLTYGSDKYTIQKPKTSYRRYITSTTESDDTLELGFLFVGEHDFINRNMRIFSQKLTKCEIQLSSEEYNYDCIQTDRSFEFVTWNKALLKLKFDVQSFGSKEEYVLTDLTTELTIQGARKTLINYKVEALQNVGAFTINDISFSSMNKGDVYTIDSFNSKIELNGHNAMDRVNLYEFPTAIGNYVINVSTNKVKVTVSYRARW